MDSLLTFGSATSQRVTPHRGLTLSQAAAPPARSLASLSNESDSGFRRSREKALLSSSVEARPARRSSSGARNLFRTGLGQSFPRSETLRLEFLNRCAKKVAGLALRGHALAARAHPPQRFMRSAQSASFPCMQCIPWFKSSARCSLNSVRFDQFVMAWHGSCHGSQFMKPLYPLSCHRHG